MPKTLVQNEQELRDWIEEGKPFKWIVEQYQEKYGLTIKVGMLSHWRRRRGIAIRKVRDDNLIPWYIEPPHRNTYLVEMLRLEARVRAGKQLSERDQTRHADFRANLAVHNAVVMYEPKSEKGFYYVPRLDADDDIIRRPPKVTKKIRSK